MLLPFNVYDNNTEKNGDRQGRWIDGKMKISSRSCSCEKQRAHNLSSLQNVHKPTCQTVSLSWTVPFLDYLMFYVSDSLSTRSPLILCKLASLEAENVYHVIVCVAFDSWYIVRTLLRLTLSYFGMFLLLLRNSLIWYRFNMRNKKTKRIKIVSLHQSAFFSAAIKLTLDQ